MPTPTSEQFVKRTDPYRRELLVHCYRMLGSIHDAEDMVQETLLRAWRAYTGYDDQRASLRTWLYRIATNACLTALEQRGRRPLPSGLGRPSHDPATALDSQPGRGWLQPIPDALIAAESGDPATIVASRSSVRLALIAALQVLPARQRAVLLLREVLAWPAADVAEMLDTTTTAVNSALQRARARLADAGPVEDAMLEPTAPGQRAMLERYAAAFADADINGLTQLLRDDVELEMPPFTTWFVGRDAVSRFLAARLSDGPGTWQLIPTRANGQAAVAQYLRDDDGAHQAYAVHVLTLTERGIARIVAFLDPTLVPKFGLPETLPH